jgi:hypothetical protein
MHHRFQNIWPLYKEISAKLTQKLKYMCEHIRFGKKTTSQVNHCNWMNKNQTRPPKEMSLKRCFEHLFMHYA